MELLFTIMLLLQVIGLIPYMFYFSNVKSKDWDKEDLKVVSIIQLPINIVMWIGSVILYFYVRTSENLYHVQEFLQEPSGIVHVISYRNLEIIMLGYILALGLAAFKNPQNRKSRLFLLFHITSMLSFIFSIIVFT